ncbi:dihydrofolate reductase [Marivirga lumbricoides]|uniref:Dihydrofolate reductase n=2 Tax=Marivirga lumbricoides TaxID=1046115 RepID=A0ABQ1N746_9BACT|nr:dihydrofolate reductase [Marivirga lumbricoides]
MIVARAQNGAIGKNNDMIWHLPDDLKYFKDQTRNHHILMGRKNFDSLGEQYQPLPKRVNMVVTRNQKWNHDGVKVFHDIQNAIDFARENNEQELFVIGGGEIYKACLPLANKLYITEVFAEFEDADAFFPEINQDNWLETSRVKHPADDRHAYPFDYVILEKK